MELLIPFGTEYILDGEFSGCEAERLILPASLRSIGGEAFAVSPNLRELVLPDTLAELGPGCFIGCESLESLRLPPSLTAIGEGAFAECRALKGVTLPPSLLRIADMAFMNSGLESVTVPESVTEIGESAFWECEALREANVLSSSAQIGENAFGCCYRLISGYIAPGYGSSADAPSELLYTLLWCSCPQRHSEAVSARARAFIRSNESLIMERIFKYNNLPAMTGLAGLGLLRSENINAYVRQSAAQGLTEITALLLKCGGGNIEEDGEFEV